MKRTIYLTGMVVLTGCVNPGLPVVNRTVSVQKTSVPVSSASSGPSLIVSISSSTPLPVSTSISTAVPVIISPTPVVTPIPSPVPTAIMTPEPSPVIQNLSDNVKEVSGTIIFKDEYRVRYDKEKKEFFSRAGKDVSSVNNILKQYKVAGIYDGLSGRTEQQADDEASRYEAGSNIPNPASFYTYEIKENIVVEFMNRLRSEPSVREISRSVPTYPG